MYVCRFQLAPKAYFELFGVSELKSNSILGASNEKTNFNSSFSSSFAFSIRATVVGIL
jgi:hypothetical protein